MLSCIVSIGPGFSSKRWRRACILLQLALLVGSVGASHARSPPPDASPSLFAGEWTGVGERGSYCYVKIEPDGRGLVLVNGGTGDWVGARMQWHNQQQNLQVDKILPLAVSAQRRTMPLEKFVFNAGFNQALSLSWNAQFSPCQLQRIEEAARQLARARATADALPPEQGKR